MPICSHHHDADTCRRCRKVIRDRLRRDHLRAAQQLGTCAACGEYRVLRDGRCSRGCNVGNRTPEAVQRLLAQLHQRLLETVDAEWRASTPWERADVLAQRSRIQQQIANIERRDRTQRPTAGVDPSSR